MCFLWLEPILQKKISREPEQPLFIVYEWGHWTEGLCPWIMLHLEYKQSRILRDCVDVNVQSKYNAVVRLFLSDLLFSSFCLKLDCSKVVFEVD